MQSLPAIRNRKPSEDGFMLLAAMFMLALLLLSLSIAVPEITKEIQRDREVETMHRGMQYRRAIQLYYRKFGNYPPSMDALVKSNNIKFLRKKYTDPMTGKDDWKVVGFGQNKAPLAMGFFGEALTGAAGGGAPMGGMGGMGGMAGGNAGNNGLNGFGQTATGGSNSGSSLFSGSNGTNGSGGTNSTSGTSNLGGTTDPTGGTTATTGATSGTGTGTSGSTGTGTGSGSGFMSGQTGGQSFGGVGMVGVSPGVSRQSILLYKKKDHYNEWEFTYSPLSEIKAISGGNAGGNGLPGSGNNTNGNTGLGGTSFGGSNNGSNSGGSNSNGSFFGGSNGGSGVGSTGTR